METNRSGGSAAEPRAQATPGSGHITSDQFSWIRTDLSNLRTLLSWVRTSVSMIGFGFTIYNFYSGIFEDLGGARIQEAARNLGLALVGFGTLAIVLAIWNFWSINNYLQISDAALEVDPGLKRRWAFSYVVAAVIMIIGVITFLFMLRVI